MPSDAFNEKQDLGYVDLEAHDGHSTTTGSHTHLHDAVNLPFQVKSQFAKEMMAEFLATFICMLFGLSCMAQVTLSGGSAGSFVTIALAWGFAYFIGISIGGAGAFVYEGMISYHHPNRAHGPYPEYRF
ncbi:hypothetical protein PC128_g15612 [Phytophthora cactorum]|nr:hypothetical protein PC128_g15612 [Phytophthora cactorum]